MMGRVRVLGALALSMIAVVVPAATAQAASVVTQFFTPGTDLIAHRYDATATGAQKLTVVATPPHAAAGDDSDWSSLTILDLDRDGRADMLVSLVHAQFQGATADFKVFPVRPSATVPATGLPGRSCLVLVPGTTIGAAAAGGTGTAPLDTRSSARAITVSADFAALPEIGGRARYGPKMATVWTPAAVALNGGSSLGADLTVSSYLPAAANGGATSDGPCHGSVGGQAAPGLLIDLDKGTDRDLATNPPAPLRQVMTDQADHSPGEADLLEADVDQWTATRPTYDVTADGATPSFAASHPADLVLTFRAGGPIASASYLASLPGGHPDALITTTGAPGATSVDVQLETGLTGLSGNKCYPRDGSTRLPDNSVWGQGDTVSLKLPVSYDGDGNAVVRVSLDRLLGIYRDASSADVPTFYWLATTLPIAGADPDYAPDYGGSTTGGSLLKCTFTGFGGQTSEGTWVDTGRMVTMSPTRSTATLTATTVHPAPGQDVTVTAAGVPATGQDTYAFDVTGSGGYGYSYNNAMTWQYFVPTRVSAVVLHPDGSYAQATLDIVPQNPPPTPSFTTDRTPPFRSASGGNAVLFTDTSTDNHLIASRHWTLRPDGGDPVALDHPDAAAVGYTFPAYEDRHWTMTLTVTDDDGAASTTTQGFDVLPYDGPGAVLTTAVLRRVVPAGKVYAKRDVVFSAADSTSVGGAPHYAWDLDGDGTFETDSGLQATVTTTYPGAGHRDVRVRVTDGRGRQVTSDPVGVDVGAATDLAPTVVLSAADVASLSGSSVSVPLDASGSAAHNPDDLSLSFAWDLNGDGIYETDTGATPTATAVLRISGDHVVGVRVTDAFGNQATAQRTIFVRGSAEISHACQGREQFRTVTYGPARASACWTQVTRSSAGPLWIARGDFALNGLVFRKGTHGSAANRTFADCSGACATAQSQFNDEGQGSRIALDPSDGTLVSNGPVSVLAQGSDVDLLLNDGPLDVTLPATTAKTEDGIIFHPPGGANLLFLKVADEAEVRFPEAGVATTSLTAELPPQMPGAGGQVTLRSTETQGIILDHLKIEVQTGVLSDYLKLADLSIEYDRADQLWTGAAELGLPGIKGKELDLQVELSIANGRFKSIFGQVDGLEVELGPGILLQRIRAGVGVDPLDLQGGIGISAGPKIAGTELFSADGDLRVTFPSPSAPYVLFQVAGNTQLLGQIELTKGILRFATNGFFEARGGISRSVGIGYFDADIGGWFTASQVNLTGNAEAGLQLLGRKVALVGAHAVLSTKGIAACGEVPVIHVGGGMGYRWGGSFTTFGGCDLGPYSEDRPEGLPDGFEVRAAAAATRTPSVTLAAGLRSANIAVSGRGAPPKVKLMDAKGGVVVDATAEQLTPKMMVLQDVHTNTTQIVLKAPARGRYVVMPVAGSAAITKVVHAVDAGPQRVRATVSGHGAKRSLRWSVTPRLARGQQLTLGEASGLDGAGQEILTTTSSAGSRAFAPQEGHGERRVVTATILTGGLGRPSTVAGSFAAPRTARPAKPAGLTLRRSGRTVTLRWAAGTAPAGGWRVTLAAGSLRAVDALIGGSRRSYTLPEVPAQLPVTAKLTGIVAGRAAGTPATASLRAGALRSGAGGAADAKPRALTARRAGSRLVVRWTRGPEAVRRFTVGVRMGHGKVVVLHAAPRKPTVTVAGLPKGRTAVRVEVRAERFGGATSAAAVLRGQR
jgi:hypothetical protein